MCFVFVLETLVSESRMFLSPAQRGTQSKRVEVSVKNQKKRSERYSLLRRFLRYCYPKVRPYYHPPSKDTGGEIVKTSVKHQKNIRHLLKLFEN